MLETLISGNKEKEVSINDIEFINFKNVSYEIIYLFIVIVINTYYKLKILFVFKK